jgi:hypothetical protein
VLGYRPLGVDDRHRLRRIGWVGEECVVLERECAEDEKAAIVAAFSEENVT